MKINYEFIKLLMIAVLCDALIVTSITILNLSHYDYFVEIAMMPTWVINGIGVTLFWNVAGYVHKHELERRMVNALVILEELKLCIK